MTDGTSDEDSPVVSVVIVADYDEGREKVLEKLRGTLTALAHQDFAGPVEYLLVENRRNMERVPAALFEVLPGLRLVPSDASSSYGLKNHGGRIARAHIVAIVDGDCIPERDWLRSAIEAMRAHPGADAISGRTTYEGRTRVERILGLLSRAYVDRGQTGPTRFLSTNNVVYRRRVLTDFPLPVTAGTFAYRMQTEAMLRAGGQLLFVPAMRVVHTFEGWSMERDMRRNVGWASIRIRFEDPSLPYAWTTRLGLSVIPLFVGYKFVESVWACLRLGRAYGLSWYDLPASVVLAFVVHCLEVPGMFRAFAGREVGGTAYR